LVLYPIVLNEKNTASLIASQAALCAGEQGKFWDMHHMLYEQQDQWSRLADPLDRIGDLAKGLGVDGTLLTSCVKSGRMRPLLEANRNQAREARVQSTPTVFINAQRLIGADGDFVGTIQRELARVKRPS
jgi:protein-disulfide isomerase